MKGSRAKKCEKVLSALLQAPNLTEAAKLAGVSEVTVWRYLKDPSFAEKYHNARKTVLDSAIKRLQAASGEAVETLRLIMSKENANPAARVSAAKIILEQGIRTSQLEELLARLELVEKRLKI
jgi:hypothetical protein